MTEITDLSRNTKIASDLTPQFALPATTPLSYTVPGDSSKQYEAEFSFPSTASVWVGYNTTPTIPTAGTMTVNARSTRNPTCWWVRGGDVLTFISTAIVTDCGIALYYVKA